MWPCLLLTLTLAAPADPDADGDGLPDFQEVHKYRTDPARPDPDPAARRESTYTVRAVLRIMPPYNLAALTDDYQDVRVVTETKDYAELEVVLYPLNTNAAGITANPTWRRDSAGMTEYLRPGATTDWDAGMRADLVRELAAAGIDPDKLTDKEVVEQVSRWLLGRAAFRTMFCTHYVHFPGGNPAVLPGLEPAFARDKGDPGWSVGDQFARELSGKGMFRHKTYGTCTSAAVYQATALRALGVPTRFVLAVPVADPSDPAQVALAETGLTHHRVRAAVARGLLAGANSYTAHTFLEVYVGRRWRRLNYTTLGQNILDSNYLGLMVKVHQFNDLSEADLAATWGARHALGKRDGEFRHANPYRALAVDDKFGRHEAEPNPPAAGDHRRLTVTRAYWADAADAPAEVRGLGTGAPAGAGRLFLHADEWHDGAGGYLQYKVFLARMDPDFVLRAAGRPDVKARLSSGFVTAGNGVREFELVVPPAEAAKLAAGEAYSLHPTNSKPGYEWAVAPGVTVTRRPSLEDQVDALRREVDRLRARVEELEKGKGGRP